MLKSAASKVMWVGRATVFLVGLAVILAMVIGLASAAFSATGGNVILGQSNSANAPTTLVGNIVDTTKSALVLRNPNGGSALQLQVNSGKAPLRVNPTAGKATNLNADKLDGKDISAWGANHIVNQRHQSGGLPIEHTFTSNGGTLIIFASGSAFRDSTTFGEIAMRVVLDGSPKGAARKYTNEELSHKTLVPIAIVDDEVPAGSHTIRLEEEVDSECGTASETPSNVCTTTNVDDRFDVTVIEIPN